MSLYDKPARLWSPEDIDEELEFPVADGVLDLMYGERVAMHRSIALNMIEDLEQAWRAELPENFAVVLRTILRKA